MEKCAHTELSSSASTADNVRKAGRTDGGIIRLSRTMTTASDIRHGVVNWNVSTVHGPIKVARVGPLWAKMNASQAVIDGLRPEKFCEGLVSCVALRKNQSATFPLIASHMSVLRRGSLRKYKLRIVRILVCCAPVLSVQG